MFSKSALVALGALALTANAHLFIQSPQPITGTNPKDPLDASGSNFPCHGVSLPGSGGIKMSAGSSQLLAFDTGDGANTAVHGGGSCQMSITYETDPAKVKDPKNWYVIYSIEGGCPSNTYQNLDGSYTGPQGTYTGSYPCTDPKTNGVDCVNQFNFTIPQGVKSGHAIMAWTWFNTVGNRELYMNCINTQLEGGDGSEMSEFPSMFVANMANIDSCPTTESVNVKFPYPGKYVTTKLPEGAAAKTASTFPIAAPTGANCASDGAPVGGGGGGGGAAPAPSYGSGAPSPTAHGSQPAYGSGSAAPPAQSPKAGGHSVAGPGGPLVTITTMSTVTASSGAADGSYTAAPSGAAQSAPVSSYAAGGSSAAAGGSSAAAGGSSAAAYGGSSAAAGGSSAPAYGGSSAAPAPSGSAVASYPPTGSGSASSGGCSSGKVSCSSPGAVVCIGSSQFGICDTDSCAVPQALAAGTHCSGGTIMKRSHMRHARAHRHGF